MAHDHRPAEQFAFTEDRHRPVFLCAHVASGAPVLYVSHDEDGDWQFLCGADEHDPQRGDGPVLECLEHIVARDPSLNALAKLCTNHHAERASTEAAWEVTDRHEQFIERCVEEIGWAVQLVAPERADDPPFAYTVGLFESFGAPELILFGLPFETMETVLNDLGELVSEGARPKPGDALSDILDGYDVRFRDVRAPESYRDHVGYGLWFYEGQNFPLLQVLWPDNDGYFPGETGADAAFVVTQPVLP